MKQVPGRYYGIVGKKHRLWSQTMWHRIWYFLFPAVQLPVNPLTSLCFHFNIYKMSIITVTAHRIVARIKGVNICKVLIETVPGKE